jgi:hypothetical protein
MKQQGIIFSPSGRPTRGPEYGRLQVLIGKWINVWVPSMEIVLTKVL